jgi:hypothetical protein
VETLVWEPGSRAHFGDHPLTLGPTYGVPKVSAARRQTRDTTRHRCTNQDFVDTVTYLSGFVARSDPIIEISKTLRTAQVQQAKDGALVALSSRLSTWTGDLDALGDIETALKAAHNLAMEDTIVQASINFCCTLQGSLKKFVLRAGMPEPDTQGHIAKAEVVMLLLNTYPEIKQAQQGKYPKLSVELFMKTVKTAMELKTAFLSLAATSQTENMEPAQAESLRSSMISTCLSRNVLENIVAKHTSEGGNFSPHFDDMVQGFQTWMEEFNPKLAEWAKILIINRNKVLASLRARLDRVGGGLDNGSSWKAGFTGEETYDMPDFVNAVKSLSEAYISAIETRSAQLRQDTQPSSLIGIAGGSGSKDGFRHRGAEFGVL